LAADFIKMPFFIMDNNLAVNLGLINLLYCDMATVEYCKNESIQ
jgi:hypothetical protein